MLRNQTDRKLESFRAFPYIAWVTIIVFGLFVFKLSTELKDNAKALDEQASSLENKVNVQSKDLKNINFEQ